MPDERIEPCVTVHRIAAKGNPTRVLAERALRIEPYDSGRSLALKADLLGFDCLIEAIRQESRERAVGTQSAPEGSFDRNCPVPGPTAGEPGTGQDRRSPEPHTGRSLYQLVPRMLAYPALSLRNRRRARNKDFPVVILYHHLIADRPHYMGMSTEQLLKQVRFLKRHYRIASLPESVAMLEEGAVSEPTVVLTFDDGYEDNFLGLRAVVEAENVPVSLFVCTDQITHSSPFQHDLDRNERDFRAMNWDQVRYLDRHGVTIGSHTRSHFDCGSADTAVLESEIAGSLDDLRRELGHEVPYFSFPWGQPRNMSDAARCIAAKTYRYVYSAFGGVNHAPLHPASLINRCSQPQSLLELELLLQSVLELEMGRNLRILTRPAWGTHRRAGSGSI
jgi:peptidoglycan/xylan/chitin deacetylase (PgdA/CDA1 family)